MSATPLPSVLVVDDDETYRSALARAFERRGFHVLTASNVDAALDLARTAAVDFASIDLRMPGASGLELVRELKALHPTAVLVVLTGYGSICDGRRSREARRGELPGKAGGCQRPAARLWRAARHAARTRQRPDAGFCPGGNHAGVAGARGALARARRVGAPEPRGDRLQRQHLAGRAAAPHAAAQPATQACQVSRHQVTLLIRHDRSSTAIEHDRSITTLDHCDMTLRTNTVRQGLGVARFIAMLRRALPPSAAVG